VTCRDSQCIVGEPVLLPSFSLTASDVFSTLQLPASPDGDTSTVDATAWIRSRFAICFFRISFVCSLGFSFQQGGSPLLLSISNPLFHKPSVPFSSSSHYSFICLFTYTRFPLVQLLSLAPTLAHLLDASLATPTSRFATFDAHRPQNERCE